MPRDDYYLSMGSHLPAAPGLTTLAKLRKAPRPHDRYVASTLHIRRPLCSVASLIRGIGVTYPRSSSPDRPDPGDLPRPTPSCRAPPRLRLEPSTRLHHPAEAPRIETTPITESAIARHEAGCEGRWHIYPHDSEVTRRHGQAGHELRAVGGSRVSRNATRAVAILRCVCSVLAADPAEQLVLQVQFLREKALLTWFLTCSASSLLAPR